MEPTATPRCPTCDASRTRVEEDVSDEVTVYARAERGATSAERTAGEAGQ